MAKAKTKSDKPLNIDDILFKCRDILRNAKNSGSFFEKRDMMLTLVFLRFIGEKFDDGIENLKAQLVERGMDINDPNVKAAFIDDPTFTDGTFYLPEESRWSTIINTSASGLNVALDTALRSLSNTSGSLKAVLLKVLLLQEILLQTTSSRLLMK